MFKKAFFRRNVLFAIFMFSSFFLLQNVKKQESLLNSPSDNFQEVKYISCTFKACSGIGNQMFRFASLYAIGENFNRSVFYSAESECQKEYMPEIKETFPNMYKKISLLLPDPNETLRSDFGLNCCKFHDPNDLHDTPHKYLILNGNYLQTYKYFNQRKAEILNLFDFGSIVKKVVHTKGKSLFKNDPSHKLCVHIRRGDFLAHTQMESRVEFVEPAIEFLHRNLTTRKISKISLIFLGTDIPFIQNLSFNRDLFHSIYHINMKSRSEDMYFGIKFCDTLLMTASGSTFAWWIGYLLPKGRNVFYNGQVSKNRDFEKDLYDFDYFPHEWTMLEFDNSTQTVYVDNRWHYEKFGWPKYITAKWFS